MIKAVDILPGNYRYLGYKSTESFNMMKSTRLSKGDDDLFPIDMGVTDYIDYPCAALKTSNSGYCVLTPDDGQYSFRRPYEYFEISFVLFRLIPGTQTVAFTHNSAIQLFDANQCFFEAYFKTDTSLRFSVRLDGGSRQTWEKQNISAEATTITFRVRPASGQNYEILVDGEIITGRSAGVLPAVFNDFKIRLGASDIVTTPVSGCFGPMSYRDSYIERFYIPGSFSGEYSLAEAYYRRPYLSKVSDNNWTGVAIDDNHSYMAPIVSFPVAENARELRNGGTLTNLIGFGPVDPNMVSTDYYNYGAAIVLLGAKKREIQMEIRCAHTENYGTDDIRMGFSKDIYPGRWIVVRVSYTDGSKFGSRYIKGVVTAVSLEPFASETKVDISIFCESPYFEAETEPYSVDQLGHVANRTYINDMFSAPYLPCFEILATGTASTETENTSISFSVEDNDLPSEKLVWEFKFAFSEFAANIGTGSDPYAMQEGDKITIKFSSKAGELNLFQYTKAETSDGVTTYQEPMDISSYITYGPVGNFTESYLGIRSAKISGEVDVVDGKECNWRFYPNFQGYLEA